MSIRFTVTDRSTGKTVTVPAPSRAEYVKDGKRMTKVREGEADACKATLKHLSVHGMRGGCLA